MSALFTEDSLVEQPTIDIFRRIWWDDAHICAMGEEWECQLGRRHASEVVLTDRLRSALVRLNPNLPTDALDRAIDTITADRSIRSLIDANREIHTLLRDGVKVSVSDDNGRPNVRTVRIIDWDAPANNDFLVVSQMTILGDLYKRRPDIIGFVNGIPLLLIELKIPTKSVYDAYHDNLRDYRDTIPQIFWYNACIIISNGIESKVGTITNGFEHFAQWKKISSEDEPVKTNLETMIRGVCEPSRFLDIIENFILFDDSHGKMVKILAKYHQYLGVNKAIENFKNRKENGGKIGVFWHTQGSGKSFSMMFFGAKILRKLPGNFTFVVVTDRDELDKQICDGFAGSGIATDKNAKAHSIGHLQELLGQDHRFIFTLIHKFRFQDITEPINTRDDIIIITDESHRTQYGELAMYMRLALPNASFIGFTGTPLINEEGEKTKEVFGDYVSVYNFSQSVEDKATVPIFYENRVPKVENTNDHLQDDIGRIMEEYEMNEHMEEKLEQEFSTTYHILTREDRLESIAEDIVHHYMGRGNTGKAMVVSIDKKTTVRLYLKVCKHFAAYKDRLEERLWGNLLDHERETFQRQLDTLRVFDMAVVISLGNNQNEIDEFRKVDIDFRPIRKRLIEDDLKKKFKDPKSSLRIVFVCNMWLTGFDVPSVTTLYLDKPMKGHTLMQTITRTNRVFEDKTNGLIVDYIGVFENLRRALAIYATSESTEEGWAWWGTWWGIDGIINDKHELIIALEKNIEETRIFLEKLSLHLDDVICAEKWNEVLGLVEDFVDVILGREDTKKGYLKLASQVSSLYDAILPDTHAEKYRKSVRAIIFIADAVRKIGIENIDVSEIKKDLEELLNISIEAEKFTISERFNYKDLSKLPTDKLREFFNKHKKHIIVENLKNAVEAKIAEMVRKNESRSHFMERLNTLIQEYNAGSKNVDEVFNELVELVRLITEEEERATKEWLTEGELAIFDLLKKDGLILDEEKQVKLVACELLQKIKDKLVLDWKKYEDRRTNVEVAVEDHLFSTLPSRSYDGGLCKVKAHQVYIHIYENYPTGDMVYQTVVYSLPRI